MCLIRTSSQSKRIQPSRTLNKLKFYAEAKTTLADNTKVSSIAISILPDALSQRRPYRY